MRETHLPYFYDFKGMIALHFTEHPNVERAMEWPGLINKHTLKLRGVEATPTEEQPAPAAGTS